jgi:hypothetical protein
MSTANPDAELVARGERFEKFLLEHMDAWLEWAPLMRAARAQVGDDIAVLITAIERTGCDAAQARMSELERDMQPLAEEIIAAPATSLTGLRAKALVALWEALPSHAFHHGAFEFRDDGEASRSLFDAVAGMTGLTPLVRELEARLAADVEPRRIGSTGRAIAIARLRDPGGSLPGASMGQTAPRAQAAGPARSAHWRKPRAKPIGPPKVEKRGR